jgi:tripartite-type tricarboxylate transporter receptor subunit TctC
MTMLHRRDLLLSLAALGLARPALAQAYPGKVIKLILPYTPGSPNDVIARMVVPQVSARLGGNVIVENRPGGGGSIGTKAVATAEPDGYTLLFASSISHVISVLYSSLPYDPLKDFVPVAPVTLNSWIMVAPPSLPAGSFRELVAHSKAHPGTLNFGFGQGTAPHLVGEWVKAATGLDAASIPYKGGAQAINDMLGGRIHINIGTSATLVPLINAGKIKAITVLGIARHPALPDTPTLTESGYPGLAAFNVMGILAPAGVPAGIVETLSRAIRDSVNSSELRASINNVGFEPRVSTPAEYAAFLAGELRKWQPVAKDLGVRFE